MHRFGRRLAGAGRGLLSAMVIAILAVAAAAAASGPSPAATVARPRLPAPLGLSFGMRPEEVALPVVVPPLPLGSMIPAPLSRSPTSAAALHEALHGRPAPTSLFTSQAPGARPGAPALPPAPPRPAGATPARQGALEGLGEYLRACEAAFDSVSALAGGEQEWLGWRARHLQGGEGGDFADGLPDRAGLAVAPAPTTAGEAAAWRTAGLYRFDAADGRRLVCLLFTADGLAQVFLAGNALDGLRDGVIGRLKEQDGLDEFVLTREARRFSLSLRSPACGVYCRLFGERKLVERRLWLDPRTRILVAAKRGLAVSGFSGLFAGTGTPGEVSDGLPDSFLASIDLGRRALAPRQRGFTAASGRAVAAHPAAASTPARAGPSGPSGQDLLESFVP